MIWILFGALFASCSRVEITTGYRCSEVVHLDSQLTASNKINSLVYQLYDINEIVPRDIKPIILKNEPKDNENGVELVYFIKKDDLLDILRDQKSCCVRIIYDVDTRKKNVNQFRNEFNVEEGVFEPEEIENICSVEKQENDFVMTKNSEDAKKMFLMKNLRNLMNIFRFRIDISRCFENESNPTNLACLNLFKKFSEVKNESKANWENLFEDLYSDFLEIIAKDPASNLLQFKETVLKRADFGFGKRKVDFKTKKEIVLERCLHLRIGVLNIDWENVQVKTFTKENELVKEIEFNSWKCNVIVSLNDIKDEEIDHLIIFFNSENLKLKLDRATLKGLERGHKRSMRL
ncbi:hypothetical protein NGRA_1614 [Nosema granulosis]|uniref:Uncharacterized protein n=1 Tax=Nosema granulosis TaxID=83296 RepID=A0A9P6KZE6_9MICR|nr:hypothetical protein NGRA_1614 [Nosema granulosis]